MRKRKKHWQKRRGNDDYMAFGINRIYATRRCGMEEKMKKKMKKKMIDWKRAAIDGVPCYFWTERRGNLPAVGRLTEYGLLEHIPFETEDYRYKHCELILDSDKEKYTIEESEYRACESLEEFRPFMGKIARRKVAESEFIIDFSSHENWLLFYNEFELLAPINGSKVIGVKV